MSKARQLFFHTKMTWKRVFLLSVITGIAVGLIMIPDFLDDTSFQNPGVTVEFWILWALYIILNCEKPVEAGVKTFVAFLISQPVIYLVQVPFCWRGWEIFSYYKPWFYITLMTLPGGMIAWFTKKGNALSVAILSVANGILCFMIPSFFQMTLDRFPHHLLTVLFMLWEIVFFILLLFRDRKKQVVAFVIAALLLVGCSVYTFLNSDPEQASVVEVKGNEPYTLLSESDIFTVTIDNGFVRLVYHPSDLQEEGRETIVYRDADNIEHEIHLTYGDGTVETDAEE